MRDTRRKTTRIIILNPIIRTIMNTISMLRISIMKVRTRFQAMIHLLSNRNMMFK